MPGIVSVPPSPPEGGRRAREVMFAGACLAVLMPSIDQTIVATALPTITRALHTTLAWSVWTVSVYQLGMVMATPIAGRLSDTLGRRRTFLAFVALFTASSVLCGLSANVYMLVGFRLLEALGGGGFTPSITGLVADHFGADRDRRVGLVMGIVPLGALVGPAIGGVVVTYLSWRLIFFVNLPLSLVVLTVLSRVLPRSPRPRADGVPIDFLGSGLLCAAILAFMLGVSQLGDRHPAPLPVALSLAAAAVLVPGFSLRQKHTRFPIFPALPRRRVFALLNVLNFLYGAASIGAFSLVPLYAQVRYGISPLEAGLFLTVRALTLAAMTSLTSMLLLDRLGYRRPIAIGYLVAVTGMLLTALPSPPGTAPIAWLTLTTALYGSGIGTAMPLNVAAFQLMPERIGALTGIRMMFRQLGAITSLSIAGAVTARNASPATALASVFAVLGLLTLAAMPLIRSVPEPREGG
ncbi:MAG TPA: MFS transporter [Candidatus Dormibacteraeota bacterium]|nr:MFS transporter [Candidatus Dormibacteraeota bacterium]